MNSSFVLGTASEIQKTTKINEKMPPPSRLPAIQIHSNILVYSPAARHFLHYT